MLTLLGSCATAGLAVAWCRVKPLVPVLLCVLGASCSANARSFDPHDPNSPLRLVRTIELPNVTGRIDHMALDPERNHLFVAEYGNGTVDELDLRSGRAIGRIGGLHEPQGVAWLPMQQEIAVASGDGLVTFYRGLDLKEIAAVPLGEDADNVRLDKRNGNLLVGYGAGGLAVIEPVTHGVIRRLMLSAHPEAFELLGARVFVNVPDAHAIEVADLDRGEFATFGAAGLRGTNYPMASDALESRIAVAFRHPGTLSVSDAVSGALQYSVPICDDADDLYFYSVDIVIVCGEGAVELVEQAPPHRSVRISTQRGARTGLLDLDHKRLFVAVPQRQGAASIWELSFSPNRPN